MDDIYNILTQNKLKWFVDSGSLLGLVREGHYLEWDKGVDISVIVDSFDVLERVSYAVNQIKNLGFYIAKFTWNEQIYKYVLSTNDENKYPYNVDLHLFVRQGNNYVCPQISPKEDMKFPQKLHNMFLSVKKGYPIEKKAGLCSWVKFYIKTAYKLVIWKKDHSINLRKLVEKQAAETYYWLIPEHYVLSTVLLDNTTIYAPSEYIEYLGFRYGNWRVPKKDWVFLRDDHSIKKCNTDTIDKIIDLYQP